MIDPSSSDEESDEDQNVRGSASEGRGASGGHVSRRRGNTGGGGSGAGPAGSNVSGFTASPGGHSQGSTGSPSLHGGSHGRQIGGAQGHPAQQETAGSGLDVPNSASARNSLSPSMSATQDAANYAKSAQRPTSPSPSVASEKTEVDLQVNIYLLNT